MDILGVFLYAWELASDAYNQISNKMRLVHGHFMVFLYTCELASDVYNKYP
jgi:hypothetical protein